MTSGGQEQTAQEAYEISSSRVGVEVVQTIDLSGVKIAWPFRALIWFITRFGKSVEQPYLERLKQAVEQQTVTPRRSSHPVMIPRAFHRPHHKSQFRRLPDLTFGFHEWKFSNS